MLARYRIVRGKRPAGDPLPDGTRIDTRRHTQHVLRPEPEMVDALLEDATDSKHVATFERAYLALLGRRFKTDRSPFDALASQARSGRTFIGCACPTKRQPNVHHCHTVLALRFMATKYADLEIELPPPQS